MGETIKDDQNTSRPNDFKFPAGLTEATYFNSFDELIVKQGKETLKVLDAVYNQLQKEENKQQVLKQLTDFKQYYNFLAEEHNI